MTRWLRKLVPGSRRRAGLVRFEHSLEPDHADRLFEEQRGVCAISGLAFSLTEFPDVLVKHPFAPSLDRISSHGGYTADNVRLVCIAVNFGMGQWGEELYLTFARAAVIHSDRLCSTQKAPPALAADEVAARPLTWFSLQRERLAAAETIAATLTGKPLLRQRRRIAGLKRVLTLGPEGLSLAGHRAAQARASHKRQP